MNKKLLTLAVGAALAAGMSVAQAEVALYGKAHVSIDVQDNDAGTEETFVSDNSSRFGIRANEDLGGGLKALAQWEMSARTDISSPIATNRNAFLGLASDSLGTIRLGKYDTPYKDIGRKLDLFNERIGDSRNVIGTGSSASAGPWDARPNNSVGYTSPSLGPVRVDVLYSADEGNTGAAGTRYASASATYTGGPVFAALGYEEHNTVGGPDNETGIRLGVGFKTGALTLNALYETLEDIGNTVVAGIGVPGVDITNYGVGAAFKFGNATAKAQYFISETDVPAGADSEDSSLMAVGLDYAFSKTVTGYVAYAQADNDFETRTQVGSGNGGHGDVLNAPTASVLANAFAPSAFSVGMEMNF